MTLQLGAEPERLVLVLVAGADLVTGLDSLDGDWPATATVRLVFNDPGATAWTATVSGPALDWNIDKTAVDALIAALPREATVRLTYDDGATNLVWAQGAVSVR